ncbi:MAG: PIN domain-containing protein [Armatimonadetes bacterium]|nr:PIN domain-containing protein [Armatimonadota bacterium]
MRILLDTSVLVAAIVEAHPAHERALPWLQRIRSSSDAGLISAHSLAEVYATLTTLPLRPRLSPETALRLIRDNILSAFEVVPLSDDDYVAVINHLAGLGVTGGAIYDALIMHAAAKSSADQVVTLNDRDFRRVCPALADRITVP